MSSPQTPPFETDPADSSADDPAAARSKDEDAQRDPENEVRSLVAAYANAMQAQDAGAVVAFYDPAPVRFDIAAPLVTTGADALDEDGLADWLAGWTGPLAFDLRDLVVCAGDDLAYCHALIRFAGTRQEVAHALWARWTLGLRRHGGQWRITHEHCSAAIDPETGAAQMSLD